MRFRFSGLILLVRFVVNDIKSLVGTIYLQISHLHPAQVSNQPSFLIWGIFALTRISFKLLTLQKTIIVTMPYYCSLLYVKRRCIMVIMFFNWAKEVWWAIFIAVFSSFFFFFFFFWVVLFLKIFQLLKIISEPRSRPYLQIVTSFIEKWIFWTNS